MFVLLFTLQMMSLPGFGFAFLNMHYITLYWKMEITSSQENFEKTMKKM